MKLSIVTPAFVRAPNAVVGPEEDQLYLTHECQACAFTLSNKRGVSTHYFVAHDYGCGITCVETTLQDSTFTTQVLHNIDKNEVVRMLVAGEEFDVLNVMEYKQAHAYGI